MWLALIRPLLVPLLWVLAVFAVWISGDFHGRHIIETKWNEQKLLDKAALQKERDVYAKQITDANDQRDLNRAELDRVRALPHPHIVCHAVPVPTIPSTAADSSPSAGVVPPSSGQDITDALYAEADRADALVEAFRDYQNRVPKL